MSNLSWEHVAPFALIVLILLAADTVAFWLCDQWYTVLASEYATQPSRTWDWALLVAVPVILAVGALADRFDRFRVLAALLVVCVGLSPLVWAGSAAEVFSVGYSVFTSCLTPSLAWLAVLAGFELVSRRMAGPVTLGLLSMKLLGVYASEVGRILPTFGDMFEELPAWRVSGVAVFLPILIAAMACGVFVWSRGGSTVASVGRQVTASPQTWRPALLVMCLLTEVCLGLLFNGILSLYSAAFQSYLEDQWDPDSPHESIYGFLPARAITHVAALVGLLLVLGVWLHRGAVIWALPLGVILTGAGALVLSFCQVRSDDGTHLPIDEFTNPTILIVGIVVCSLGMHVGNGLNVILAIDSVPVNFRGRAMMALVAVGNCVGFLSRIVYFEFASFHLLHTLIASATVLGGVALWGGFGFTKFFDHSILHKSASEAVVDARKSSHVILV